MKEISGIIDVGNKKATKRIAKARATVLLTKSIVKKIEQKQIPKGDIFEIARVSAIMAVKKTQDLIPHCHNIPIENAEVDFKIKDDCVIVESVVKTVAKTGVEMEAMVACSIAALTIYDVCKMYSKAIEVKNICLVEKRGGKSGVYKRSGK